MTKLAIAGDSFATTDPNGTQCSRHGIPYLWPEELARKNNAQTTASGVGGADIYASTFRATQQIVNDNSITHMLFFITDFNRDLLNNANSMSGMIQNAVEADCLLEGQEFYESHNVDTYSESDGCKFQYLLKEKTDNKTTLSYYAKSSPEKTLHAGMACLSQLALVCEKHNVNLIFVHSCFVNQESFICHYADKFMLNYNYFSYTDVLGEQYHKHQSPELTENRLRWPAHMSPAEQPQLLKGFNLKFPSWLKQ